MSEGNRLGSSFCASNDRVTVESLMTLQRLKVPAGCTAGSDVVGVQARVQYAFIQQRRCFRACFERCCVRWFRSPQKSAEWQRGPLGAGPALKGTRPSTRARSPAANRMALAMSSPAAPVSSPTNTATFKPGELPLGAAGSAHAWVLCDLFQSRLDLLEARTLGSCKVSEVDDKTPLRGAFFGGARGTPEGRP